MSVASEAAGAGDPVAYYRGVLQRYDAGQRHALARVKRAMERYVADAALREALEQRPRDAQALYAERGYDLGIDLDQLEPVWRRRDPEGEPPPLLALWQAWHRYLRRHRDLLRGHASTAEANPRFDAWRRREMARCDHMLPEGSGEAIVHPIVAFELSSGCSVGCWFCGVDAERFRGAWPYTPENAAQWRDVLQALVDRFGAAARSGFCYWATDPCDNPDYDRFLADFLAVTGYLPQTTTAAPLKDPALTRRVLALAEANPCVVNRFSVLTLRGLEQIHAAFTPDELLTVELVIQTRESLVAKAQAGRMRARKLRQQARGDDRPLSEAELDGGTIACITGFLVNLPEGSLKLISPCTPDEAWPLGYRVYAEGRFADAEGFAALLDEAVERCMPAFPPAATPLAWRSDLTVEAAEAGGLELTGRFHRTRFAASVPLAALAERLRRPTLGGELLAGAMAAGADLFSASQSLQNLYDGGLIEPSVETMTLAGARDAAAAPAGRENQEKEAVA